MQQTIAKTKRAKKGLAWKENWTVLSVRAHIPTLISEVQDVFMAEHNIQVSPSDILTNALKAYKEKLRPA